MRYAWLFILSLFFACKNKQDVVIQGEFPSNNNAVATLNGDNTKKIVNVKNNKFYFRLNNAKAGFYQIHLDLPHLLNDFEYYKDKNQLLKKSYSVRSISTTIYIDPKLDTVYKLRLNTKVDSGMIDNMDGKTFTKLKFNLNSNNYDSNVYEDLKKIKNKYIDIFKLVKDSLDRKAEFYLDKGEVEDYRYTLNLSTDYWKVNLIPKMQKEYSAFMMNHLNSIITPYLIDQSPDLIQNAKIYKSMLDRLSGTAKGSSYEKSARKRLESIEELKEGEAFPKPIGELPNEKAFEFNPSKSRYTLIEFWASWCVPCRAKNPELISIYQKYPRKHFDVLGVSIDTDREVWLSAIKKDRLPWQNVSDLLPINLSDNTSRYNVFAIPYNFLIDNKGNVVAKDIKTHDLKLLLNKL